MGKNSELYLIDEHNFESAVVGEEQPVLLLCMPRDDQFPEQIDILMRAVAGYSGCLKAGLLHESFISSFKKRYNIPGTPTFLILEQGREKNRSLGLADEQMLVRMIMDARLPSPEVS